MPVISGIDPAGGAVGQRVTVDGSAFGPVRGSSSVSFGGTQAATYISWSDTRIVCTVPAGISGRVEVAVETTWGASNTRTFGVYAGIESLSPAAGIVGSKVNITGSAFGPVRGNSFVSFGGVPADIYDSWSDTSIVCYVPAGISGQVEVAVTTSGGSAGSVPFTVTTPASDWYLAEGSTAGGMETFILVQNPGDVPAEVTLSFMTEGGPKPGPAATLQPGTRRTFKANDYVYSYDVSTLVSSDQPVVAERAMYGDGRTWAHDSIGVTTPATRLVPGRGLDRGGYGDLHPGAEPRRRPRRGDPDLHDRRGTQARARPRPCRRERAAPSRSTTTCISYDVSTLVSSDQPVVAERAMYGDGRTWAHDSIGVTAPASDWYLAEGSTAGGMETFILVQNPGDVPAEVTLTFMTEGGPKPGPAATLPPGTRRTFKANDYVHLLRRLHPVSSDQPVVAERAMYGDDRTWAHDSIGVTTPASDWYLAEGSTAGGMETFILVQNPGDVPAEVTLTFMTEGGPKPGPAATLQPGTRRTFKANDYVYSFDVSTLVSSDQPVVAERAMYGDGRTWAHDSIGA